MPAAILTYHSLDDSGSVISTAPALFAQQMEMLSRMRVSVLSLTELWAALQAGSRDPLIAITFDDGFKNVHDLGLPVLKKHGFPATMFVVSDFVGRDNGWPTQPVGVTAQPLASWDELSAMRAAGLEIGGHTRTHPELNDLTDGESEAEIAGDKAALESMIGGPVRAFAYPYGRFQSRHTAIAARHYPVAVSATLDYVRAHSDPVRLERLDAYYLRRHRFFEALFTPRMRAYLRFRRHLREVRARVGGAL